MENIVLSVIIPTLGRNKILLNALKDLAKQKLDPNIWECIIISQTVFSDTFLNQLKAVGIQNLRFFYSERPNASLARNIGIKESSGEILLFIDDDIILEHDHFLSSHLENYKTETSLCAVYGQILNTEKVLKKDLHKLSKKKNVGWLYFPSNYIKKLKVKNGTSCNLSVKKEFAIEVGGMDANYIKGAHREESDFCLRLTKKYGMMNFDPKASLIHIGESTGGVRSWGHNSGIHPMHHIVGEWYFILNGLFRYGTIKVWDLHHHIFQILWRQIFNKPNLKKIIPVFWASMKSMAGFFKAASLSIRKPALYHSNSPVYKQL